MFVRSEDEHYMKTAAFVTWLKNIHVTSSDSTPNVVHGCWIELLSGFNVFLHLWAYCMKRRVYNEQNNSFSENIWLGTQMANCKTNMSARYMYSDKPNSHIIPIRIKSRVNCDSDSITHHEVGWSGFNPDYKCKNHSLNSKVGVYPVKQIYLAQNRVNTVCKTCSW